MTPDPKLRSDPGKLSPPPDTFEAPLSEFVDQHVLPNFASGHRIAAWTDALLEYFLGHPDPVFVVRGRKRGVLRSTHGLQVVDSDNSPGIWAYLRCWDGRVSPDRVAAVFEAGDLPVLMAIGKEDKASWTYGEALSGPDKAALWSRHLKHCHILPARPRGLVLSPRQSALRNVCPANHFLFPSPRAFAMERLGWTEASPCEDLGESERVIAWVLHRLAAHLDGHQPTLDRFLAAAGGTLPKSPPPDGIVRIVRRERKSSAASRTETAAPMPSPRMSPASGAKVRRWTINAGLGYYVATGLSERGIDLTLSYRHLDGNIESVGVFQLDLQELARIGVVNCRRNDGADAFDVRIVRDGDGSYWLGTRESARFRLA